MTIILLPIQTIKTYDSSGNLIPSLYDINIVGYRDIIIGAGDIGNEVEKALIGHHPGDKISYETNVPEFIPQIQAVAGNKVKLEIEIISIHGYADLASVTDEVSNNNMSTAFDEIWTAYYSAAMKKYLKEQISETTSTDISSQSSEAIKHHIIKIIGEEKYNDAMADVSVYFQDYIASVKVTADEYLNNYAKIPTAEFDKMICYFVYADSIRKDIESKMSEIKHNEYEKYQ